MRYTQPKVMKVTSAVSAIQTSTTAKFGPPIDSNDPEQVNTVGTAYEADE